MNPLTQAIYEASRPDAFQALFAIPQPSQAERTAKATELYNQGYIVDWPIDVWGFPADLLMADRINLNDLYVPSAFMVIPPGTDLSQPWGDRAAADPVTAPRKVIKASVDAADYPPFHPATPPPVPSALPIGTRNGNAYSVTQAAFNGGVPIYPPGAALTAPNGDKVVFTQAFSPFGIPGWEWLVVG